MVPRLLVRRIGMLQVNILLMRELITSYLTFQSISKYHSEEACTYSSSWSSWIQRFRSSTQGLKLETNYFGSTVNPQRETIPPNNFHIHEERDQRKKSPTTSFVLLRRLLPYLNHQLEPTNQPSLSQRFKLFCFWSFLLFFLNSHASSLSFLMTSSHWNSSLLLSFAGCHEYESDNCLSQDAQVLHPRHMAWAESSRLLLASLNDAARPRLHHHSHHLLPH